MRDINAATSASMSCRQCSFTIECQPGADQNAIALDHCKRHSCANYVCFPQLATPDIPLESDEQLAPAKTENAVRAVLEVLSRSLESNPTSVQLWSAYLNGCCVISKSSEIQDLFDQAIEYTSSPIIWLQYLSLDLPLRQKLEVAYSAMKSISSLTPSMDHDAKFISRAFLEAILSYCHLLHLTNGGAYVTSFLLHLANIPQFPDPPALDTRLADLDFTQLRAILSHEDAIVLLKCVLSVLVTDSLPTNILDSKDTMQCLIPDQTTLNFRIFVASLPTRLGRSKQIISVVTKILTSSLPSDDISDVLSVIAFFNCDKKSTWKKAFDDMLSGIGLSLMTPQIMLQAKGKAAETIVVAEHLRCLNSKVLASFALFVSQGHGSEVVFLTAALTLDETDNSMAWFHLIKLRMIYGLENQRYKTSLKQLLDKYISVNPSSTYDDIDLAEMLICLLTGPIDNPKFKLQADIVKIRGDKYFWLIALLLSSHLSGIPGKRDMGLEYASTFFNAAIDILPLGEAHEVWAAYSTCLLGMYVES